MAKQPNSGLDYTPKNPQDRRPMERAIFTGTVRQQRYPFFEVVAAGVTIEWTDVRVDAHNAFVRANTLPKQLVMVQDGGRRILLDEVSATGRGVIAAAA